jgi:hypothetical protein
VVWRHNSRNGLGGTAWLQDYSVLRGCLRCQSGGVGSKTFNGVWFAAYPDDHLPPHVHGRYAEADVIVELVDGRVRLAHRSNSIRPRNAKQSDVSYILRTAAKYSDELMKLWRMARG